MRIIVRKAEAYSRKSVAVFMAMCLLLSCMVVGLTSVSIGEVQATSDDVFVNDGNTLLVGTTLFDYFYDTGKGGSDGTDKEGNSYISGFYDPYNVINNGISDYYANGGSALLNAPLYFGNFWDVSHSVSYNGFNRIANLSYTAKPETATVGLLKNGITTSEMDQLPYFNSAFLEGTASTEVPLTATITGFRCYWGTGTNDCDNYDASHWGTSRTFQWGQNLKIYQSGDNRLDLSVEGSSNYSSGSTNIYYENQNWQDAPKKIEIDVTVGGEKFTYTLSGKDISRQRVKHFNDYIYAWVGNYSITTNKDAYFQIGGTSQYGKTYSGLKLPFQKKNIDGVDYWVFDGNTMPVYVNNNKIDYYYTANGESYGSSYVGDVYDYVAEKGRVKPGFFPFNNGTNGNENAVTLNDINYGFGTKMEIEFTLPDSKKINGKDIEFNFKGDDDIWVFINDTLVLDMGGDHGQASGTINFTNGQSIINTQSRQYDSTNGEKDLRANRVDSTTLDKALSKSKNGNHKMTIYYMERGMFESNMYISFNMVMEDVLRVENKIDTEGVNSLFKTETLKVAEKDVFNYTTSNDGKAGIGDSILYPTVDKNVTRTRNGNSTVMSVKNVTETPLDTLYFDVSIDNDVINGKAALAIWFFGGTGSDQFRVAKQYGSSSSSIFRVQVPDGGYKQFLILRTKPGDVYDGLGNWSGVTDWGKTSNMTLNTNYIYRFNGSWNSFAYNSSSRSKSTYPDITVATPNVPQSKNKFGGSGDGNPVPVANTNYLWYDDEIGDDVVGKTDNDGSFKLLYSQGAMFTGQFVKNSNMTVIQDNTLYTQAETPANDVTPLTGTRSRTVSNYYTTKVSLIDAHDEYIFGGSSGGVDVDTGNQSYKFLNNNGEGSVKLCETFVNKVRTGSLTISKDVPNDNGAGKQYSFTVVFSNIFGGSTDTVTESFTLTNGGSKTIEGIPVGTEYTITETSGTGYIVKEIKSSDGTSMINTVNTGTSTGTIPVGTDDAKVTVTYTNELVRDITIAKEVYDSNESTRLADDTTDFTFEITLTKDGAPYTETIATDDPGTTVSNGSKVTINQKQAITLKNVPIDVEVKITEKPTAGYKLFEVDGSSSTSVTDNSTSDVTYTFKNKKVSAPAGKATIQIKKYIDELYYGESDNPHGFSDDYSLVGTENAVDPHGYEAYTEAEQSFIFKIEKIDSTSKKVLSTAYVVLKFDSNSRRLETADTSGYVFGEFWYCQETGAFEVDAGYDYKVSEMLDGDNNIAWRYQCPGLNCSYKDGSGGDKGDFDSNGSATNKYVQFYEVEGGDSMEVTFYNLKNTDKSSIEGDMSSKKNEISAA